MAAAVRLLVDRSPGSNAGAARQLPGRPLAPPGISARRLARATARRLVGRRATMPLVVRRGGSTFARASRVSRRESVATLRDTAHPQADACLGGARGVQPRRHSRRGRSHSRRGRSHSRQDRSRRARGRRRRGRPLICTRRGALHQPCAHAPTAEQASFSGRRGKGGGGGSSQPPRHCCFWQTRAAEQRRVREGAALGDSPRQPCRLVPNPHPNPPLLRLNPFLTPNPFLTHFDFRTPGRNTNTRCSIYIVTASPSCFFFEQYITHSRNV